MHHEIKKVAAIHDLSGVGRCSLSVILPTLSAMGVQACPVPTAILSAHTGGFGTPHIEDLTAYPSQALHHYQSIELAFDCIYSGYLGSIAQIDHCLEFFAAYPDALHVVDPVMGDHGKLYTAFSAQLCRRMGELVSAADLITPNLTEASLLLGEAYPSPFLTQNQAKSWLSRLHRLGPKFVVITGAPMADGTISNLGYEAEHNAFWRVDCDYVSVQYPGTGDLFASVVVGAILSGDSLPMAMARATSFLELVIKTTYSYQTDPRHGVMFEKGLPFLTQNNVFSGYRSL